MPSLLLLAALPLSCTLPPRTQILVRVSSNLGAALSTLYLEAQLDGDAQPFVQQSFNLTQLGVALPATYTIAPRNLDERRALTVRAAQQLSGGSGTPVLGVAQRARVTFVREHVLVVDLFLEADCADATIRMRCESQLGPDGMPRQCSAGGQCVDLTRATLADFDPDAGPDVSVDRVPAPDASPDAPALDATALDVRTDTFIDTALDVPPDSCVSAVERSTLGATVIAAGAPRLLAPLSGSIVSGPRPTLRWTDVAGAASYDVQLCRDRAMTTLCRMGSASSASWPVDADLARGVWFWRARAVTGGTPGAYSPTWELFARGGASGRVWGDYLDLDGDGREDVVMGGAESNGTPFGHGAARLLWGGFARATPGTATLLAAGQCGGEGVASRLASAGDLNGDGFSDLLVGATYLGGTGLPAAVRIYYGSATRLGMSAAAPQVFVDNVAARRLGGSLAGLGDVNGDGYGDVALGLPGTGTTPTLAGEVWVLHGGPTGLGRAPATTLTNGTPADHFGAVVAAAGDVNGDGFADLLVSAPDEANVGVVRLYLGSAAGVSSTAAQTFMGTTARWRFGSAVRAQFDADGDGWPELAIGAPSTRGAGATNGNGEALVYPNRAGAAGMPYGASTVRYTRATMPSEPYAWGWSLAAGDFDGDGYDDLAVGAAGTSNASFGRTEGSAFAIYRGSATGLGSTRALYIAGSQPENYGESLSARDLDGDGYWDLLVGYHVNDNLAGSVKFYFGASTGLPMTQNSSYSAHPGSSLLDGFGAPLALLRYGFRWGGAS